MPHPALLALFVATCLCVVGPLLSPFERRFWRSNPNTKRKLAAFGIGAALAWSLSATVVAIYGWKDMFNSQAWATGAAWLPMPMIAGPALGVLLVMYFGFALMPLGQGLRGPRWRGAYAAAFRRQATAAGIGAFLPDNTVERIAFVFLSLTAGICEEVLCRGFLIHFLHDRPLILPIVAALMASSLAFGLNHLYQGPLAALSTALTGLSLGLLFLLTGSLIAPMIVHVLIDLQLVYVLRPIRQEAD